MRAWVDRPVVRYGELYAVLNAVEGVDYVGTLTLAADGGAQSEQDVTIPGPAALTRPGVIDVQEAAP